MIPPIELHRPGPAARGAARLGGHVPMIDTPRLQLRGPRIYDFAAFADILCSDRAQYMGGPLSRPEAWALFANHTALWMLQGHGLWTLDGMFGPACGFVLLGYEHGDPEPELGLCLIQAAEGQGLAQEAVEAARTYAFDTLQWDSVVSCVDPDDLRSTALMDRLGARRDTRAEGALRRGMFVFRHLPKDGGA